MSVKNVLTNMNMKGKMNSMERKRGLANYVVRSPFYPVDGKPKAVKYR